MTTFNDLTECNYFGGEFATVLRAVGWLGNPTADSKAVDRQFFEKLVDLLVDPWQPFVAAGRERCGFCRFTGGPAELRSGGKVIQIGTTNLFVPSDGCVYVAPSMIAHFIDAHAYVPPREFQDAVGACPPMRSMAYLKRIREFGIHKLASGPIPTKK